MHDPLRVHVDQRLAELPREVERAFGRQRTLRLHDRAQRRALDVLHRDVHPAFLSRREHLDDVRMVEPPADLLLALEALVEDHVALELQVGNLDRDAGAVSVSIALKIDAMPLRAISSVSSY